jgi:hypothetical protein
LTPIDYQRSPIEAQLDVILIGNKTFKSVEGDSMAALALSPVINEVLKRDRDKEF